MRVKICGITNLEDAEAAIAAGADALGFILYEKSKRFIPIENAIQYRGGAAAVCADGRGDGECDEGVHEPRLEEAAQEFQPGAIAWRGVARACEGGRQVPAGDQGFSRRPGAAIAPAQYDVSAFMLDTPSKDHGGTGRVYDWNLAVEFKKRTTKPLILSGGLNPENVAKAIETVHPYAVDVAAASRLPREEKTTRNCAISSRYAKASEPGSRRDGPFRPLRRHVRARDAHGAAARAGRGVREGEGRPGVPQGAEIFAGRIRGPSHAALSRGANDASASAARKFI